MVWKQNKSEVRYGFLPPHVCWFRSVNQESNTIKYQIVVYRPYSHGGSGWTCRKGFCYSIAVFCWRLTPLLSLSLKKCLQLLLQLFYFCLFFFLLLFLLLLQLYCSFVRLWQQVTRAINNKDQTEATQEKYILEEAQRRSAKERKLKGEEWACKLFDQDPATGEWHYKYAEWVPENL